MASVKRHQKLPSCQTEPFPAHSKTVLLVVKAQPISDNGGAPTITYLGKDRKHCTAAARGEYEKCERNSTADTKVTVKGRQEVLQALE